MENSLLDIFDSKGKAIHHALWLNFKYRIAGIVFGVIPGHENNFAVCEADTASDLGVSFLETLPDDYSELPYNDLRKIKMDRDPLPHWSSIIGMFSVADGEILRFLLHHKVPLEKLIRHELASRGYDKNHRWCGFDKATEIWLE